MKISDEPIIQNWYDVYLEYLSYTTPSMKAEYDELWKQRTDSLVEYWCKMNEGELQKISSSFVQLLLITTEYYALINENFRRNGGIVKPEFKNTGGRYLP